MSGQARTGMTLPVDAAGYMFEVSGVESDRLWYYGEAPGVGGDGTFGVSSG